MPKKRSKFKPEQIAEAIHKMASKAKELGWSPTMSREEKRDAQDNPKFVSVKLSGDMPMGGFILDWQAEKVGFGQITFYTKNKILTCDTETMGAAFVKAAMLHFLEKSVLYDPKG
jgi:hypothetical protein